ncbi:MAG: signal recognition particle-docking protein FtsY [Planctomycetota bacterium]
MALFGKKKTDEDKDKPKKKEGIFRRLVRGLGKTIGRIAEGLGSLVGRRIDEELIEDVEASLLQADLGPELTEEIIQRLTQAWKKKEVTEGEQVIPFLKAEFKAFLTSKGNEINLQPSGPTVILVVGVNGTGKTTSIGKIAWHYQQLGKKVMVAAGDTYRAAAESQLRVWAEERVGCLFHMGKEGDKPDTVAYTAAERAVAENVDILIVDTAGRLHTDRNLMEQLGKIKRVIDRNIPGAPHEVLLVLDANVGQNAIRQAEVFRDTAGVTGLVLAKLDATGKGGVVLNIHNRFDIPVKFVGLGEQKDDLAKFNADQFVDALFDDGEGDAGDTSAAVASAAT